jgi:mannosyltransferase OCH1-like enzyme
MRRALVVFLLVNILIIAFLIHSCFTLLTLLIEDGAKDAIPRAEIPAPNSPSNDSRPQLIPKIIHQTYINESIPARWRDAHQSCLDLHEEYEYKVGRTCSGLRGRSRNADEPT